MEIKINLSSLSSGSLDKRIAKAQEMLSRAQEEVKKRRAALNKLKKQNAGGAKKSPSSKKASPRKTPVKKPLRKGQYYKDDGSIGRYVKKGTKFYKEDGTPA